jgi:hypothetical protein
VRRFQMIAPTSPANTITGVTCPDVTERVNQANGLWLNIR